MKFFANFVTILLLLVRKVIDCMLVNLVILRLRCDLRFNSANTFLNGTGKDHSGF